MAANAWGDHDTKSKSQSGGNLGNGGKGEALDTLLVDKNKGDYVISLWMVTSLVVPYVMAPMNLAFKFQLTFKNDRTNSSSPRCTVL